jgi:hypothetical protein
MKARKKPVIIEAIQIQYDCANWQELKEFCPTISLVPNDDSVGTLVVINTLEGQMYADDYDWIIKGVKGEFYPCKSDIFALTYDIIEEPQYTEDFQSNTPDPVTVDQYLNFLCPNFTLKDV